MEDVKVKAQSFAKKLAWMTILGLILFSTVYYFYRDYTVSEGTRTGLLFKISKKGKVFKTYEGQIQLAGATIMNKERTFEFSTEESVYQSLQMLEGKNVRLHYREKVDAFPWQGDTNYIVYQAEEVK
ncbi:MAG: hypothetical protein U0T36_07395 [Saprospiraceae bacterium]